MASIYGSTSYRHWRVCSPVARQLFNNCATEFAGRLRRYEAGGYSEAAPEGYQQGFQQCSAHLKGLANIATNVSRFGLRDRRSIKADWRQWRLR